jgi:hypothetical protein
VENISGIHKLLNTDQSKTVRSASVQNKCG